MNNLEQVIKRAKRDIALKYVYVMMPIPQLQTLIDGLEEAQKRVEVLQLTLIQNRSGWEKANSSERERALKAERERDDLRKCVEELQRELDEKDDAIAYAMNQIQIKESHIRKMEESQKRVEELEAIIAAVKEDLYAWKDAEHARACISTILPACKGASA